MNLQFTTVILIAFSLSTVGVYSTEQSKPLVVTVYYESLCPDAIQFFTEQLKPSWLIFGDAVKWIMIPYGKATHAKDENGVWQFTCQHGASECETNGVQASLLSLQKDPNVVLGFISCYMQGEDKETLGYKCGEKFDLDYDYLKSHGDSAEGRELLAALGDETHSVKPKIEFIPAISFNNQYNFEDSEAARKNLFLAIARRINSTNFHPERK